MKMLALIVLFVLAVAGAVVTALRGRRPVLLRPAY